MPVVEIRKDPKLLTMTVTAQFAAPVARVWAAYADPRQLERFWGPPEWPAKFERHDFTVGGRSEYVMTGPNGEQSRGFWEFLSIDQPRAFEVEDGFLGPDGKQAPDMPTMRMRFTFEPHDGGTRMVTVTTFPSLEALEQAARDGYGRGAEGRDGPDRRRSRGVTAAGSALVERRSINAVRRRQPDSRATISGRPHGRPC